MREHRGETYGSTKTWSHKQKGIYKWIRGKSGNGPFIVAQGGSAQMKARLKLTEEMWGGLCAVGAEDLHVFQNKPMASITEDEVRRVVNNLADGKAKGVDGWSPAELRALSRSHIQGLADLHNKIYIAAMATWITSNCCTHCQRGS
jgi:hypothetical protein